MADYSHNVSLNLKDKPDSQEAHHDDLFEDVGKKVDGMGLGESGDKEGNRGPKLVDEIESYCMNCGENVWFAAEPLWLHNLLTYFGSRALLVYS